MSHKTFKGGVHVSPNKELTKHIALDKEFVPQKVVIPMIQHIGAPCTPTVKKGDVVKVGDVIGTSDKTLSAPIHASISGVVSAVEERLHPSAGLVLSVEITRDNNDISKKDWPVKNDIEVLKYSSEDLMNKIKQGGLVGLGGAAFPSFFKLNPPKDKNVDTLIINGAECEPFLNVDFRLMVEQGEEILKGILIFSKILKVKNIFIGIEENKMEAVDNLSKIIKDNGYNIKIVVLKEKYPQGGEKQLITAVTGKKVPPTGLPMDVGICVHNVGTAFAAYEIVYKDKPVFERAVTVSGDAIKNPKNVIVPIGTLVSDLIAYCGGFITEPEKVVMGGPMMGIAQYNLNIPVLKGTSGITIFKKDLTEFEKRSNCIRCSRCIDACPMELRPQVLEALVKKGKFLEAKDEGLMSCIECGACAFNCPAKHTFIQEFKQAKQNIKDRGL